MFINWLPADLIVDGNQVLGWRSSPVLVVAAIGMTVFTDAYLHTCIVPVLPYISEIRLRLNNDYTQIVSLLLLSQGTFVSATLSPVLMRLMKKWGSKQTWMLGAFFVALLGSVLLAAARNVPVLLAGRFLQAVASSAMCVVGHAIIEASIRSQYIGKVYRIIEMATTLGNTAGSLLTGLLFGVGGYWSIWLSVVVVIAIDVLLRVLMVDPPEDDTFVETPYDEENVASEITRADLDPNKTIFHTSIQETSSSTEEIVFETTPLIRTVLPDTSLLNAQLQIKNRVHDLLDIKKRLNRLRVYWMLLQHRQFLCSIISCMTLSLLISTFDTTLPLHIHDSFGWESMHAGLLFTALHSPSVFLGPLCQWMKNRMGSRHPIAIGFLTLAPLMWLLGTPGDTKFPWANEDSRGPVIYAATVALIGVTVSTMHGTGSAEATAAVDEIESLVPGSLGKRGYARALSLSGSAVAFGKFLGPVISGALTEGAGYYEMCFLLALICVVASINAFVNMGSSSYKILKLDPEEDLVQGQEIYCREGH